MKKTKLIAVLLFLFVSLLSAQVDKKLNSKNTEKNISKTTQKTEVHASVQSAKSTSSVASYDFTTGSNKYYGGTVAAVEVEPGVWAMIAGDANGSGIVTNSDKDPINNELNSSGYYNSDINMSGIVTNADKDFINSNINKSSQVPN